MTATKCDCDRKFMQRLAHPDRYNVDFFCWHCGWQNDTPEGRAAFNFNRPHTDEQAARRKEILYQEAGEGFKRDLPVLPWNGW